MCNRVCFSLTTSRSQNLIPKSDFNKNVHINILKKKLGRVSQYLEKFKNGFPIIFSKCDLAGGKIFLTNFFSEKAKHLRMCPSIGVNLDET